MSKCKEIKMNLFNNQNQNKYAQSNEQYKLFLKEKDAFRLCIKADAFPNQQCQQKISNEIWKE